MTPSQPESPEARPSRLLWTLIFAGIVVANWAVNLPTWLQFPSFAFGDPGASLTTHDLVNRGLVPAVDFAHHYGLLGILLGKVWFGILGATPWAFLLAMLGFGLWMAGSLAALATDRPTRTSVLILTAVAVPYWIQSCYPNLAHGLEAALLCQAIREHSRGRRGVALALATAALFAKPSLGFPYGLILLIDWAYATRGRWSLRGVLGHDGLGPAIVVGVGLLLLCSSVFGPRSTILTLIPTTGISTYKAGNFGFFRGVGSQFWYRPGFPPGYYFGTVVGFWIVATVWLTAGGLVTLVRFLGRRADPGSAADREMAGSMAALHAFFVTMLFGHMFTWVYDSFVLGAGLISLNRLGRACRLLTIPLIVLALAGHTSTVRAMKGWTDRERSAETLGLWDDAEGRADWIAVRAKLEGKRTVLLSTSGCLEHLEPTLFEPAVSVFIVPGTEDSNDAKAKARLVAEADRVLVPWTTTTLQGWPLYQPALAARSILHSGPRYRLYGRSH